MKQKALLYGLAALAGIFLSFTELTIHWQYWAFIATLTAMNVVVGVKDYAEGYEKGYDKGFAEAAEEHTKGNWE